MNTKKLLALITVICLLVCVAIPVAAAPGDRAYPEYNEELMGYELVCDGSTNVISVPAGEVPNLFMTAGSTVNFFAMDADGNPGTYLVYFGMGPGFVAYSDADGNASAEFASGSGALSNYSEVDLTFFITVTEPVGGGEEPAGPVEGTMDNPIVLTELGAYTATAIEVTNPWTGMTYGEPTYYKWVANTTGLLILTVDNANPAGFSYCVNNYGPNGEGPYIYGNIMNSMNETDPYFYAVPVTEGDEISFYVGTSWCNPSDSIDFNLTVVAEPDGTFNSAAELNQTEITVPAGTGLIYTINSMLNGMDLTVEGEGIVYTLNNVLGGAALDGTPANLLLLVNEGDADVIVTLNAGYPIGSEGNPIPVNVPADLTSATVPMFGEVWYAVSSRLDGTVLTVEGEGTYVIVNGTRVDAVDGVVTVNLVAEGATIPVVIGNGSMENAEYACTIEYLPIEINAAGSFEAQVSAGAEVAYLVNSRLDGYTLTVKGEGAYVIVNGEKVEAVDGVVTVTLEAKGATIPVVIGNAGEAAATYECNIEYVDVAPPTGDMIAVALVMMLTSGTALVSLKKKEN